MLCNRYMPAVRRLHLPGAVDGKTGPPQVADACCDAQFCAATVFSTCVMLQSFQHIEGCRGLDQAAMRCCKKHPSTPLERFAASLTTGDVDTPQEFPILFPMYTVLLDVVLRMTSVRPHEQLLEEGALTIFKERMGQALFVSHQWVTKSHPDPEFKQFRVLQEALQNIMSGLSQVSTDMITEAIFGLTKAISASELQPGKLFLWYDYFCCPQDPVLTLHCSGQKGGNAIESNQQRAISSIPAYISKCKFFMALCPVVESPDESQVFSQFTWAGRGRGKGLLV